MKKVVGLVVFLVLLAPPVLALARQDLSHTYFGPDPKLTKRETATLKVDRRWRVNDWEKPVAGKDGSIQFTYGAGPIDIVCAVLQVTDVQLQPGEQVNNINVGDPRWIIDPAVTGQGKSAIQHLIIKPTDVGLTTSLIVTTNCRTYHFRLRSDRKRFMPYVTFIYPNDGLRKWKALEVREKAQRERAAIPVPSEYLGNLNFGYTIKGRSPWRPLRVYDDGKKTIIQMPKTMTQTEAPALLVLRGGQHVLVNYRIQGDRYIVDTIFNKAVLVAGVGDNQEKVTIIRDHAAGGAAPPTNGY